MRQTYFPIFNSACAAILLMASLNTCAAETTQKQAEPAKVQQQKSIADRFNEALSCIKLKDSACARVALASINPASSLAKIIQGQIALLENDNDGALRLLLPLQADGKLSREAAASLHASLALAYDRSQNPQLALEEYILAEKLLTDPAITQTNQNEIVRIIQTLPRSSIIEIRGASENSTLQGWIDLVIAAGNDPTNSAFSNWHSTYPDHPATAATIAALKPQQVASSTSSPAINGKLAILLPLDEPAFAAPSQAILAGIQAAQEVSAGLAIIQVYPTKGLGSEIVGLYQQAIAEGATKVIGPLTREEVTSLAKELISVPTMALNQVDTGQRKSDQLIAFGLPIEPEAQQVAQYARNHGMQSAIIVGTDSTISQHMKKAFIGEWKLQLGEVALDVTITADTNLSEIKTQTRQHPADMIFLATTAAEAHDIRPYLDSATPTFALSHIYSGSPDNALLAIHFADMPWLITPNNANFSAFKHAGSALPAGDMQRWYALGVDAYQLLARQNGNMTIPAFFGLTGKLELVNGTVTRLSSMAQLLNEGVTLEQAP